MRSIGEMARDSGLSVSALRFYDGAGVLVPAWVDPVSGYRWYGAEQLEESRLLARLRRFSSASKSVHTSRMTSSHLVSMAHKTTTNLARTYATVVVEQLDITNMVKSARGTIEEPGKNVAQKSGLNRSISQEAWGRTVTMLTYKTARYGGTLHKVPAPGTSLRCSVCGFTTPGSRESQAVFVCKNEGCGWSGNADENAARNVLHLYRTGHALVPAAGRAVARRTRGVKPAAAR